MAENTTVFESIIIGGGPAGIAVAHTFKEQGISSKIFEKGPIGHHIAQYPTFMRFFSTKSNLEIAEFPLAITEDKPTRQEYLQYLAHFVRYHKLNLETYAIVTAVERREDGIFAVSVKRPGRDPEPVFARTVVVAVGAWEYPRHLGVPGDELDKVIYRFTEAHPFFGKKVLVVGGRNSAIEAALLLYRNGADVSISYRRSDFGGHGVKYWLLPDIENRIKKGEIKGYLNSQVARIDWDSVTLKSHDGEEKTIENDFVLPCLGYDPPVAFLKSLGIDLEEETNKPSLDPDTLESNIPGMFVVGAIITGNVSGKVFIENSRHHGETILPALRKRLERVSAEA